MKKYMLIALLMTGSVNALATTDFSSMIQENAKIQEDLHNNLRQTFTESQAMVERTQKKEVVQLDGTGGDQIVVPGQQQVKGYANNEGAYNPNQENAAVEQEIKDSKRDTSF